MAELFRQLAFIAALLGGFAITFLSVLLTASTTHRMVDWIVGVTTAAATCFVLSALSATFGAVVANWTGPLPSDVDALHEPLSLLFLAGTVLMFGVLGMSGWVRSRPLGHSTAAIALLGLLGCPRDGSVHRRRMKAERAAFPADRPGSPTLEPRLSMRGPSTQPPVECNGAGDRAFRVSLPRAQLGGREVRHAPSDPTR